MKHIYLIQAFIIAMQSARNQLLYLVHGNSQADELLKKYDDLAAEISAAVIEINQTPKGE